MRKLVVTAALVLTFVSSARAETPTWMTPGPGRDETAISCGVCHTVNYIKMNSPFLKPDVWKAELDKMRTVFAAPIDDDTAATILTYLNKNFGVLASK